MSFSVIKYGIIATTCFLSPLSNAKGVYNQSSTDIPSPNVTPLVEELYASLIQQKNWLQPSVSGRDTKLSIMVMNGKSVSSQPQKYSAAHPICPMKPKQNTSTSDQWQKGNSKSWSRDLSKTKDSKKLSGDKWQPKNKEKTTKKPQEFPGVMWKPKQ